MRVLSVIAAVLAMTAASPRHKRQSEGCFWWLEDCNGFIETGQSSGGNSGNTGNTNTDTAVPPPTGDPVAPTNEERTGPNNGGLTDQDRLVNQNNEGNNRAPANIGKAPAEDEYDVCDNGLGRCVPYYLCRDGSIITDGSGLIDVRIGPGSNKQCNRTLDLCCKDPYATPPPPTVPIQYQPRCGRRNEEGVNARVTGFKDNQAQFGEFPWMAAILRTEVLAGEELNLYVCGGSLIHQYVILTAAHCVHSKDPASLKIRLGEWDTQQKYELYPHVDHDVQRVVIHEGYVPGALWNDFALLFLTKPAELAPNVDTICLPEQNFSFDDYTCWATGWGKDNFGKHGTYQNILKEIALPVVNNYFCEAALQSTRLGQYFKLDPSFICAGGEPGLDTCKGDGGSPLVCQLKNGPLNTYVQAGIVAWGIGCGENGIPGVYANVAGASNWITSKTDYFLQELYAVSNAGYWPGY